MKKSPVTLGVTLAAVVALMATACGSDGASSETPTDAGPADAAPVSDDSTYIAMVAKQGAVPYWQAVLRGAEAAAEEFGVEITFTGPDTELEVDKQINLLQSAMDRDPDVIAFAPLDSAAALPLVEEADSRGIPVFAFDSVIEGTDIPVSTIATDNYATAAEAAKHMVELLGGEGKIAVLAHSQVGITSTARRDGFVDYIESEAPGVEIVTIQYNEADQAKSANQTAAILQANPDLVGIFATNVDGGVGAANEIQSAGRDIVLISFDSGSEQVALVRSGVIAGLMPQNPYRIGYLTVKYAVDYLAGEEVPATVDSGSPWATAENLDDPEVAEALYD